jgi:hypothetical protein
MKVAVDNDNQFESGWFASVQKLQNCSCVYFLDEKNVNLMFTHLTTQIIAFRGRYAFDVEVAEF